MKPPKYEDRANLLGQQKFNDWQAKAIKRAYKEKLSEQQIKIVADNKITSDKMLLLIDCFVCNFSIDEVLFLKNINLPLSSLESLKYIMTRGLSLGDVKLVYENLKTLDASSLCKMISETGVRILRGDFKADELPFHLDNISNKHKNREEIYVDHNAYKDLPYACYWFEYFDKNFGEVK